MMSFGVTVVKNNHLYFIIIDGKVYSSGEAARARDRNKEVGQSFVSM